MRKAYVCSRNGMEESSEHGILFYFRIGLKCGWTERSLRVRCCLSSAYSKSILSCNLCDICKIGKTPRRGGQNNSNRSGHMNAIHFQGRKRGRRMIDRQPSVGYVSRGFAWGASQIFHTHTSLDADQSPRRRSRNHCGEGLPIPRGLASLGGVGIPMPNSGLTGLCHSQDNM